MFGLFSWFLWSSVWQNLSVSLGSCKTKSILKVLNNELKYGEVARDYKLAEFSERNEGVDCLPSLTFLYLCFAMICGIFSRVLAKPHNGLNRIFQIHPEHYLTRKWRRDPWCVTREVSTKAWRETRSVSRKACGYSLYFLVSKGENVRLYSLQKQRLVRKVFLPCAVW